MRNTTRHDERMTIFALRDGIDRLKATLDGIVGQSYDAGIYGEREANLRLAAIRGLAGEALRDPVLK